MSDEAPKASEYPEHDKMRLVQPFSQACGAFIDWLGEQGYAICERVRTSDHPNASTEWAMVQKGTQALLAEHFEINLDTIEAERRAMLRTLNPDLT